MTLAIAGGEPQGATPLSVHQNTLRKARVALGSILTSAILSLIKLFVGLLSGSLALIADAFQGFIDITIGSITYHAVTTSNKPADARYTYGREKLEVMAALFESALLSGIALLIWFAGLRKLLFGGTEVHVEFWFIVVVAGVIIADLWRHVILRRAARETGSLALSANSSHFLADSISSSAVLLSLIFVSMGFEIADPIATIVVSTLLAFASYRVGRPAIDVLLDRSDPNVSMNVADLIEKEEGVAELHQLRVRNIAQKHYVEAVIGLRGDLTVTEAANIKANLANRLEEKLGFAEVMISAVPASVSAREDSLEVS